MTQIHRLKKVPDVVRKYFEKNFPSSEGHTYKFYWYMADTEKIYGCEVFKDGEYYHNATQASEKRFEELLTEIPKEVKEIFEKISKLRDELEEKADKFDEQCANGDVDIEGQWENPFSAHIAGLIDVKWIIEEAFKIKKGTA